MRLIYATITLINGGDLSMIRRNLMDMDEVKQMNVTMLVDTGSVYMCINENIQAQLQIPVVEKRKGKLADGSIVEYDVVAPVDVRFKNRRCTTSAMVLPGDNEPLLGAIPLEDMDVVIHQQRQELIVNPDHPYFA
jgi:clan AA aspartic protease